MGRKGKGERGREGRGKEIREGRGGRKEKGEGKGCAMAVGGWMPLNRTEHPILSSKIRFEQRIVHHPQANRMTIAFTDRQTDRQMDGKTPAQTAGGRSITEVLKEQLDLYCRPSPAICTHA